MPPSKPHSIPAITAARLHSKKMQKEVDAAEVFHFSQFDVLSVTRATVPKETRWDSVLARIHKLIVKGWSVRVEGDKPYYERNKLSVHQECNLWGNESSFQVNYKSKG